MIKRGRRITSSGAFLVYASLMFFGLVISALIAVPYESFAINFTIGLGAYLTKRTVQKHEKFNSMDKE